MSVMKRVYTAIRIDRSLAAYSPAERSAIKALVTGARDVKKLARQVFQQLPPDNSGPYAMLLLHAEGELPHSPDQNYLVIDKITGRKYYVFYDGMYVVHNGKRSTLTEFNTEFYRWFRIPEFSMEDLNELS